MGYPPAPFHLLYGMVRDEYGTPINLSTAEVILETIDGKRVKTRINPGIETAANYWLEVPMDSGLMAPHYQPSALRPTAPFRLIVRVGATTFVPIEMVGNLTDLGEPGRRTRINLTLGEDSDGDGLPDAWERLIDPDLAKVRPDADAGNGLNHLETYYAGTYTVDPTNGFALAIAGFNGDAPLLEFIAVTGRRYTLLGSSDLRAWETLPFRIPAHGTNAPVRGSYTADTVANLQIEAAYQGTNSPPTYFRLLLQ